MNEGKKRWKKIEKRKNEVQRRECVMRKEMLPEEERQKSTVYKFH